MVAGTHDDPFRVLGPHGQGGARVVRAFVPGADALRAIGPRGGRSRPFRRLHPDGLFEGAVPGTGRYTLEAVRDVDDLERVHSHELTRIPGVTRVSSSVAMRTVVKRGALPV